jgi:serine/threonine protein kinase
MKLERYSGTGRFGGALHKYYIQCNESSIQNPTSLHINNERAIVKALLEDGMQRKNQRIVVKIGPSETLKKEYTIGQTLKHIPGFIRYICAMTCNDNLTRYSENPHAEICRGSSIDPRMNVIVMPYYPLGSFRTYDWVSHPEQFKSALKQLFLSLYLAFVQYGFLHNDIHLDNVLVSRTQKQSIRYNETDTIPTNGIRIQIMDFDKSFISVARTEVHALFYDYRRILLDIEFAAKIEFDALHEMQSYVQDSKSLERIPELLQRVDTIVSIRKKQPPRMEYNPNVW